MLHFTSHFTLYTSVCIEGEGALGETTYEGLKELVIRAGASLTFEKTPLFASKRPQNARKLFVYEQNGFLVKISRH